MRNQVYYDERSLGESSSASTANRSSSKGHSSTEETHNSTCASDETIKNALGRQESQQVFRLRTTFILILLAAAAAISTSIYFITSNAQAEEFEIQYQGVARKVMDAFQNVIVEVSAVSGLAVLATSYAQFDQANNVGDELSGWPFVTLKHFQEQANNARSISGSIYVSINPIVERDQLPMWETYVQREEFNSWINEGLELQETRGLNDFSDPASVEASWLTEDSAVDPLHTFDAAGNPRPSTSDGPLFLPRWQTSPVLKKSMANENLSENPAVAEIARICIETKSAVFGGFVTAPPGSTSHPDPTTSFFATLRSIWDGKQVEYLGDPMSHLVIPIFDTLNATDRKVVAVLESTIHWRQHLRNMLAKTDFGIRVVVENSCDGNFTYQIDGPEAHVIGFGDQHGPAFDKYRLDGNFRMEMIEDGTLEGIRLNQDGCPYSFHVYPTEEYQASFTTNDPIIISCICAVVFLLMIVVFLAFDHIVERRQRIVLAKATESTAIVSSLFPKQIGERLLAVEHDKRKGNAMAAPNHRLKTFLDGSGQAEGDQPIADFFPACTVLCADITGFSAWSSQREPVQVFILLQNVYQRFDRLAQLRKVFKVETIGDSYLAVTGLPEPQNDHATRMAKFAWDCLIQMEEVTKDLEVTLGPDTGDLSMRFGLNSGAVTAGVLKIDRARFQLFGDTVNTAELMESTGQTGRIQCSEATALLLREAGKESWLTRREDVVRIAGKGSVQAYWVSLLRGPGTNKDADAKVEPGNLIRSDDQLLASPGKREQRRLELKEKRLVDWMADILVQHIQKLVIVRQRCTRRDSIMIMDHGASPHYELLPGKICLDEVREAIHMPAFNARVTNAALDSNLVKVPEEMLLSLREYVAMVARGYRHNPFHNFEHACHVTMSVNKLLGRVVTPNLAEAEQPESTRKMFDVAAEIHNFTHGITSDPMASFAIVFSALIHDVDHQGISNVQLIKEEPEMGRMYRNKSVAEQNSLDVAWDMLMSKRFDKLRKYIFGVQAELMRFRQLIVNVVLATDIFDKELGDLRKARWERAFDPHSHLPQKMIDDMRATIVMEHIIQASDVSHTMQHWHVYQKWNRMLFEELYKAWKAGRMGADPTTFWYKGEIGFFDNYIIPLAKKLKDCNVFGVSSDEYLGYALKNRDEWAVRGEEIVANMVAEIEARKVHSVARTVSSHSSSSGTSVE